MPDDRWGEQVCAWVRVRHPIQAKELIEWCRGRISHQKCPRAFAWSIPSQ
ncbi:hypothetical protein QP185_22175 [Sphingomonas aerolata]